MQCDFIFSFHMLQRERFRDGTLVREWRRRYPQLFDDDDERVLSTEHQRRYHFFEWLSAVLLFEATGYFSLVEKYTSKSHTGKRSKLKEILSPDLFTWLCENESGQPDLFVYDNSTRDWFFCEVKGGADRIRSNQLKWINQFARVLHEEGIPSRGRVRILCLQEVGA